MSVRIIVGDVRDKLAELAPESVDCVVTSPPYWGLRDYQTARWEGGNPACEHVLIDTQRTAWANSVKGPSGSGKNGSRWANTTKEIGGRCGLCEAVRVDDQIGMESTLGEHLSVMVEVFDLVRRAMKPEATLWLNYGDCYATKPNGRSAAATKAAGNDDRTFRDKPFSTVGPIYDPNFTDKPRGNFGCADRQVRNESQGRIVAGGTLKPKDLCMIPNRLAIALQDAGWWVRSEIVWGKPNPMPDSSGRYRPSTAHEKLFLLSKSANCFYDAAAVAMPCSPNTHARLAQDVDSQAGSDRAVGKTNGRMKAVGNAALAPKSQKPGIESQAYGEQPESRYLRNYEPDLSPIVTPEVWAIATAAFSEAHFATFPPALVVPCLLAGCPEGGKVLDPFFGAGTTGLVADRLQRNCIGIELNAEYAELARKRLLSDAGVFADISVEHSGPATRAA